VPRNTHFAVIRNKECCEQKRAPPFLWHKAKTWKEGRQSGAVRKTLILAVFLLLMFVLVSPVHAGPSITIEGMVIERTPPPEPSITFVGTPVGNGYASPLLITIGNIQDAGSSVSGVMELEYSLNDGATPVVEPRTSISGTEYTFEINTPGTYSITARVIDNAGNASNDVKKDVVVYSNDNTPPVITILGDNPITLVKGSTFTDPGAVANDLEDGDLTDKIVVLGSVNTAVAGTYEIVYTVADSGGLTDTKTRTVIVVALEGLSISPASVTLSVGEIQQYQAKLIYTDGTERELLPSDVSWSIISGDGLASITNEGLLTALGVGTVELGATYIDADMVLYSAFADITIVSPGGTVIIKYQDNNGLTLRPPDVYENVFGEHTYVAPHIEGYEILGGNTVTITISANGESRKHIFVYPRKAPSGGGGGYTPPDMPIDEPMEEPTDKPVEETVDEPTDEPTEAPAEEPIEEAVDEPIEEPAGPAESRPAPVGSGGGTPGKSAKAGSTHARETQSPTEVPQDEENNVVETGVITGRIIKDDGTPLSGARIELHSEVRIIYTDGNGVFRFENVPFGVHRIYLVDDRLKSGRVLIKTINIVANTDNVIQLSKTITEEIAQCSLSESMPTADFTIKLGIEQLDEEKSPCQD